MSPPDGDPPAAASRHDVPLDHAVLPDDLRGPDLIRLHADWTGWRRGDRLPGRADFDPLDLAYLLGRLLLMDVVGPPPLRLRYRLIGSTLVQRNDRDLTGRFTDAIADAEYRAYVEDWHRRIVETRRPGGRLVRRMIGGRWTHYEMLTVPLSSDGATVDMTLSGFHYILA